MRKSALLLAALTVSVWSVCPSVAGEFAVKLSVTESAGVARQSGAMSGGIPLPKGMFKTGQPFALFSESGKELPCPLVFLHHRQ